MKVVCNSLEALWSSEVQIFHENFESFVFPLLLSCLDATDQQATVRNILKFLANLYKKDDALHFVCDALAASFDAWLKTLAECAHNPHLKTLKCMQILELADFAMKKRLESLHVEYFLICFKIYRESLFDPSIQRNLHQIVKLLQLYLTKFVVATEHRSSLGGAIQELHYHRPLLHEIILISSMCLQRIQNYDNVNYFDDDCSYILMANYRAFLLIQKESHFCVEIILHKTIQILKDVSEIPSKLLSFEVFELAVDLIRSRRQELCTFDFFNDLWQEISPIIFSSWQNSIDAVQLKSKSVLIKTLALQEVCCVDKKDVERFLLELLEKAVEMEWNRKAKYGLLQSLIHASRLSLFNLLSVAPRIFEEMIEALGNGNFTGPVSDLFLHLLKSSYSSTNDEKSWFALWIKPVTRALLSENSMIRKSVASHILPCLADISKSCIPYIEEELKKAEYQGCNIFNGLILVIKFSGELNMETNYNFLQHGIHSNDELVRLEVLGLICSFKSNIQADSYRRRANLLKEFIICNFQSSNSDYRRRFYCFIEKFCISSARIKNAEISESFSLFLSFLLSEIMKRLNKESPYQVQEVSLQLLKTASNYLNEIFDDSAIFNVLLDCIANPFDTVRQLSFEIIGKSKVSAEQANILWNSAMNYLVSPKSHQGDAAAKILTILFSNVSDKRVEIIITLLGFLEKSIEMTRKDISKGCNEAPLYSLFLSLNSIVSIDLSVLLLNINGSSVIDLLLKYIEEASTINVPILSHKSPEGNLMFHPSHQDEEVLDEDFVDGELKGPKEQLVLSCTWRAAKECVALLTSILVYSARNQVAISADKVEYYGLMIQSQLTSIRHKGAFSSIFPSFVLLCTELLQSPQSSLHSLPLKWLKECLDENSLVYHKDTMSFTRRSAGIPFCILALVKSESNLKQHILLHCAMDSLLSVLKKNLLSRNAQSEFPIIHTFNILRSLIKDSSLSSDISPSVISECCIYCLTAFSHSNWAIRNSALLIYSSLITIMFGGKKVKDDLHPLNGIALIDFHVRYPSLFEFCLSLLTEQKSKIKEKSHSALFPVLLLFSKLHCNERLEGMLATLVARLEENLMFFCIHSEEYQIRELSAHAIASIFRIKHVSIEGVESNNALHGRLLIMKKLSSSSCFKNIYVDLDVPSSFICAQVYFSLLDKNDNIAVEKACLLLNNLLDSKNLQFEAGYAVLVEELVKFTSFRDDLILKCVNCPLLFVREQTVKLLAKNRISMTMMKLEYFVVDARHTRLAKWTLRLINAHYSCLSCEMKRDLWTKCISMVYETTSSTVIESILPLLCSIKASVDELVEALLHFSDCKQSSSIRLVVARNLYFLFNDASFDLNSTAVIKLLINLLQDDDECVREAAVRSMDKLFPSVHAERATFLLAERVKSKSPSVAEQLCKEWKGLYEHYIAASDSIELFSKEKANLYIDYPFLISLFSE